jgi:hypothetical protein
VGDLGVNAFLDFADQQMPRALKRRIDKLVVQSESEAPMVPSPMERQQQEASAQFRKYEKWRRERRDAAVAAVEGLGALLKNLTPAGAAAFIGFFQKRDWSGFDAAARFNILAAADDAIIKMRVQHGLPPMDDSLPGEPPRVFEVIRKILTGVGH